MAPYALASKKHVAPYARRSKVTAGPVVNLPVPYSHKYCTVPYQLNHPGNKIIQNMPNFVTIIIREIHHQNCEMKLPRNFTFGLIVKFYRNKENNFEIYHTAIIRKIRDIFGSVTRPSVGRSVPEWAWTGNSINPVRFGTQGVLHDENQMAGIQIKNALFAKSTKSIPVKSASLKVYCFQNIGLFLLESSKNRQQSRLCAFFIRINSVRISRLENLKN